MELLDYIVGLAAANEGETALIVRQTPVMRNGEHQRHADGMLAFTYPAFLPTHRRREGEAWYINAGSFIIDRFKDGKPRAMSAHMEHTLFLMLDDIGTKSKEPLLPPTWVVETSAGNYQWYYAYADQPKKGEHVALFNAMVEAGYARRGQRRPPHHIYVTRHGRRHGVGVDEPARHGPQRRQQRRLDGHRLPKPRRA